MKRFLCLLAALALLSPCPWEARAEESSVDYTMADKLIKQLEAGSGFSGTLQVESTANEALDQQGIVTLKPLEFQWDYIHVRQDGLIQEEQRIDLALMDEDTVLSTAHFQWKDQGLSFQTDLLSPEWFRLTIPVPRETSEEAATMNEAIGSSLDGMLKENGLPSSISAFLPVLLGNTRQNENLERVMERFVTYMDVWIESYRQSTVLGKLEDGTGTIALRYVISPTNIKAQLKQLIVELFSDASVIARLEEHFGADSVAQYLKPEWDIILPPSMLRPSTVI